MEKKRTCEPSITKPVVLSGELARFLTNTLGKTPRQRGSISDEIDDPDHASEVGDKTEPTLGSNLYVPKASKGVGARNRNGT